MNELFSGIWPAAGRFPASPASVVGFVIVATTTSAAPGPEATRRLMWMLFLALALLLGILVLGVALMTTLRARRGTGGQGGAVRGATGQPRQAGGRGLVDPWAESGRRLGVGVARRPGRPAKSGDFDDFDLGSGDEDQSEGPAPPN